MRKKLPRCLHLCLSSTILMSWLAPAVAGPVLQREPWPLIQIPDPIARRAVIDALETASARFADADCRKILTDFEDGNGRALADQLSSLAVDIQRYLTMITFIDDRRHPRCVTGILATTAPGSRVVRVCADELKSIHAQQPEYVAASFIHEILHTLGLGENPPSSRQITARVLARCGGKQAAAARPSGRPSRSRGPGHRERLLP